MMFDGLAEYENLLIWAGIISLIMLLAMIAVTPWLVGKVPDDYFINETYTNKPMNTPLQWCWLLLRNMIGMILMLLGIVMLFTPGQGIITMLLALIVMQFPGKRALEKRIIGNDKVLLVLNWLRAKNNKPPFKI